VRRKKNTSHLPPAQSRRRGGIGRGKDGRGGGVAPVASLFVDRKAAALALAAAAGTEELHTFQEIRHAKKRKKMLGATIMSRPKPLSNILLTYKVKT
jgi:hypothetical protein